MAYKLTTVHEMPGGGQGDPTLIWKPTVAEDGTISWTRTNSTTKPVDQNIKGPKGDAGEAGEAGPVGPQGEQGTKGEDGADGVSPVVTIVEITGGYRITITDKDHPQGQSFDIMNGDGSKLVAMTAEKALEVLNA